MSTKPTKTPAVTEVPCDAEVVIQQHSRSFSSASRLLPASIRSEVRKLYAWCRWCDDAVDAAPDADTAKAQLDWLRSDVERIYRGEAGRHEASRWLAELVSGHNIDQAHPLALLQAMDSDLRLVQIETQEALLEYCYGAAGVVGLMLTRLFGVDDRRADRHACALGIAMQLTNIARDVREDAARGRCYLPKTWLPQGIDSADQPQIAVVVRRLLDLAEEHYRIAEAGMRYLPATIRPSIRVAAAVYREIGLEIARCDYRVMRGRISISKARLLTVGGLACLRGFWRDVRASLTDRLSSIDRTMTVASLTPFPETDMKDAKYLAWLGLSLTAFMGGALFLLVLLNPKDSAYSSLPLIYAIVCFCFGGVANYFAKRAEGNGSS